VDPLRLGDHVSWIFDDDERRLRVMARLVGEGLDQGQKVLYLTGSLLPTALLAGLAAHGAPVAEAYGSGQLVLTVAEDGYQKPGPFNAHIAIQTVTRQMTLADREGWAGLRVLADMVWVLRPAPDLEQLTWYESQVNRLLVEGRALVVCQYDTRLFSPAELLQIQALHRPRQRTGEDVWVPLLRLLRTGEPPRLRLVGEADLSNRTALAAVLATMATDASDHRRPLVIDVSALTFADSGAANLLMRAGVAVPTGVRLVGCSPTFARLLNLLGAETILGLRIERRTDPDPNVTGARA
jgi:anti-anti-sigma regulatory factor